MPASIFAAPAAAPVLTISRTAENSRYTYGVFKLSGAEGHNDVTGYTLEPGGHAGPFHLSGNRLPAGVYKLDWQHIPGEGNRLVLYSEQLQASQQFQLNSTGVLPEDKGYLVLSRQPIFGATNALSFAARDAGFELESVLRKVGVSTVEVHVTDY